VRGKIVIVGATAPTQQDVHPTPTSGNRLMAGPEIQANAIWTALHGFPLHEVLGEEQAPESPAPAPQRANAA
jgi:CHASE2 domain-containing sensor protein